MDDFTCAICLQIVESKKNIAKTVCDHSFCLDCLIKWSRSCPICPICRTKLIEEKPIIPITNPTPDTSMTLVSTSNTNIHTSNVLEISANDDLPPNWPYC